MTSMLLLSGLVLSGCSTVKFEESPSDAALLDQLTDGIEVPGPEELTLVLTDEVKAELLKHIDPEWSELRRFRALRSYLFDDEGLGLKYDAKATLTASEAFEAGRGNCLAVSNLFVAAARFYEIESGFETVSVRPTWDSVGAMMIRYEHIVAAGDLGRGDEYVVDFLPDLADMSNERDRLTDTEALALYFNNRGADAVINGDNERAVQELLRSIKLWPENSDPWSNLGATFRRLGESRLSEASYKRALALDKNNYSALANLTQFYLVEGRVDEAQAFVAEVHNYYSKNPYYHYYLARLSYNTGEYEEALGFLNAAVSLKRDEKDFYIAMADTYRRLGDSDNADRLMDYAGKVKPAPSLRTGVRSAYDRGIRLQR